MRKVSAPRANYSEIPRSNAIVHLYIRCVTHSKFVNFGNIGAVLGRHLPSGDEEDVYTKHLQDFDLSTL